MKITKPYRGNRGSKRLDLTDMREIFKDNRMWCAVGIVTLPPGADQHFEISDTDVLVDVVLQPHLLDVTCRLAAGVTLIPNVGEEVVVAIPEGEMAFMPIVLCVLSSGVVSGDQPPALNRILIIRQEVVIDDGDGGAGPLATLADLQALRDFVEGMLMPVVGGGGGTAGPPSGTVPTPSGTTVLKGK